MARFVVIYKGGSIPDSPEAQQESLNTWMKWFESLGSAVSQVGSPFGESVAVDAHGVTSSSSGLTGFSVVEAETIAAAAELISNCPIYADGGTTELYQSLMM